MAQSHNSSRYQQGVVKRYYENRDTLALQNLGEIASDLYLCEDPKKVVRLWNRAAKALSHTEAEKGYVQRIVTERDVSGLCQLVSQLTVSEGRQGNPDSNSGASSPPPSPVPASTRTPTGQAQVDATDAQILKRALKAFRKRLKLTRLDDESKIGVGPLSGGKRSGVVAITPPNQYPSVVWEELVKQGKLKQEGRGFYSLADD